MIIVIVTMPMIDNYIDDNVAIIKTMNIHRKMSPKKNRRLSRSRSAVLCCGKDGPQVGKVRIFPYSSCCKAPGVRFV